MPVWFLNRRDAINKLKSKAKVSNGLIVSALILSIIIARLTLFGGATPGIIMSDISSLISIASTIILIILAFNVRKIISEHNKVKLSWIWTLLFGVLYLQYKINRFPGNKKK